MFNNCSGKCSDCISHYTMCVADRKDDYFQEINQENAIDLILSNNFKHQSQIDELKKKFPIIKSIIKAYSVCDLRCCGNCSSYVLADCVYVCGNKILTGDGNTKPNNICNFYVPKKTEYIKRS